MAHPIVPDPPPPPEVSGKANSAQEVDVWWGSYAGRAMAPSFAVCALATAVVAALAWYGWEVMGAPAVLMRYVAYAASGVIWFVQVGRWVYRVVWVNYRLTTRRLFRDGGFRNSVAEVVELRHVRAVDIEPQSLSERVVSVGRLRVVSDASTVTHMLLEGVCRPEQVADLIRRQASLARGAPVVRTDVRSAPNRGRDC